MKRVDAFMKANGRSLFLISLEDIDEYEQSLEDEEIDSIIENYDYHMEYI